MWIGRREKGGRVTGNKKHKWQVKNRKEEVKSSKEMEKPKNLFACSMDMN